MATYIGIILGVVILLVLVPVAAAVVYRLVVVRRTSTPALFRSHNGPGWCYGALKYSDTEASFYRLVSLRFGADLTIERRSLVLGARRQPTGAELDVAEVGEMIVPVTGRDRRGGKVDGEFCLGPAELTALLAWVEACSTEQVRRTDRRRR